MSYDTEKQESPTSDQRWIADESFRFSSYDEARAKFDNLDTERKRIRARPKGKFDVVVFKPFAKKTQTCETPT
jgi:hypothetical protein